MRRDGCTERDNEDYRGRQLLYGIESGMKKLLSRRLGAKANDCRDARATLLKNQLEGARDGLCAFENLRVAAPAIYLEIRLL